LKRRNFVSGTAALAAAALARPAFAATIKPYSWDLNPPTDTPRELHRRGARGRGEDPMFLGMRWDRYQAMVRNKDLWGAATIRAFLLTPREEFSAVSAAIHKRAYEHAFLDIGYGVTMSGPHIQGRMTNVIDVKRGEKVLEIGTGSGCQSAYIANLTENAYTIEIIKPLADRTRGIYDRLIEKGYTEFQHIKTKAADGYYGWAEAAPFDKIIVTCGIDHVPPPLLQQLKPSGLMVIPVGPPGAQRGAQGRQDPGRRRLDHDDARGHLRRQDRAVRALHQARRRQDRRQPQPVAHRWGRATPVARLCDGHERHWSGALPAGAVT
jgi:protein-L-isoaspartate(D-aspartate) O-methyltransferase